MSTFTCRTFTTVEDALRRAQWRVERENKPLCVVAVMDRYAIDYGSGGLVDVAPGGQIIDHRAALAAQ